ncbi:MAG: hypothetical protein H0Z39_00815 [Peptococcaceae bacterium]|nr:hypothetical protein [Peptococcaceae bacterium]
MRWVVVPRRPVVWGIALVALICILFLGLRSCSRTAEIGKEQYLNEALENTKASETYRYRIESRLIGQDGESTLQSKIEGEREAPDRIHIRGKLVNSPIEFIQVEDTTYMKDQFSGKWLVIKGNRLAQNELFITELNPLAVFEFKDIPKITYKGRDGSFRKRLDLFEISPLVANTYLETLFTDFKYHLWVNPNDKRIVRASVEAVSRGNEKERLLVDLEFWDYGAEITVKAPEQTSEQQ